MRQPGAPNAIKFTNRGNCGNCVNGGPRSQHACDSARRGWRAQPKRKPPRARGAQGRQPRSNETAPQKGAQGPEVAHLRPTQTHNLNTQLQNLIAQRADLDAQIEAAKAADFHTAVQHAAHLFGEAGVPLDEAAAALLTLHNQSARPQRAKVAPKYRHIPTGAKYRHRITGAMWTGRGKQPKWFAEADQSEIEHLSGDLA